MKHLSLALTAVAIAPSMPALAGDPADGKQKEAECIACNGKETFGGLFFTLQLAGRNADKLLIKSKQYTTARFCIRS